MDDNRVFEIDEGFGNARLTVYVHGGMKDCGGNGFIQLIDSDRGSSTIDFDLWDRIVAAVARKREL